MTHTAGISRNELAKGRRLWRPRRLLLAAALAVLALAGSLVADPAPAEAQTPDLSHCDPTDPNEIWCGSLTVGTYLGRIGFRGPGASPPPFGSLTPDTFTRSTATIRVDQLWYFTTTTVLFNTARTSGAQPSDGLLGAGTFTLEFGTGASKQTTTFTDPTTTTGSASLNLNPTNPGLSWSENDVVPVRLVRGPVAATGAPAITGSPNVGQELTAGAGTIADLNSLPAGAFPTGYTFQWVRVDGTTDTDITGATSSTYTLVAADVGKKVKVKVSFTDGGGSAEERTSGAFPSGTGTIDARRLARLASLELSHGTLTPPLASETGIYDASVPSNVYQITVTAVADDPAATVEFRGAPSRSVTGGGTRAASRQVRLKHGKNDVLIRVTVGERERDYTVTVLRGSLLARNGEVTVVEGGVYRFERSDFNFLGHRDDFRAVYITSLPAEGKGWVQVNNRILEPRHLPGGMRIQGVDLRLVLYIAPGAGDGDDFATFTFEVEDNRGNRSVSNYTMTINVTPATPRPPRIEPYRRAADSLVSNAEPVSHTKTGQLDDFSRAQGFRTGAHAGGYTLSSVAIKMDTHDGTAVPTVQIARGNPGATTDVITLAEPPTLAPDRTRYGVVYTAPPNTTLAAITDYFVVIKGGVNNRRYADIEIIDSGGVTAEPGWSIHRNSRIRQLRVRHPLTGEETPYPWPWRSMGGTSALQIEIRGAETASGSVEADPPTITGTPVVSGEGDDGTWSEGETVRVALTFSESVVVETRTGTPTLGIDLGLGGTSARSAAYESGSGATTLTFAYTLTADDGSHTHIAVTLDSLTLGGGTIRSIATGFDALLSHVGTVVLGTSARSEGGASGKGKASSKKDATPGDATPPLLSSAYVYFASMTLTFDEALDATSIPATSAFSVNVDGSPLDVSGVSVSGNTVRLGLSWWVEAGQTVTLGYTAPTGQSDGKLRDAAGNAVASFSGQAVSNHTEPTGGDESTEGEQSEAGSGGDTSGSDESTPGDTTAPLVSSAAVDGTGLSLTFDEALDTDALPAASAFTVTAAGAGRAVQTVTASDSSVTLTLAAAVVAGEAVTVDYTAPADESAARLRDLAGNAAASFSGVSVTNHTPVLLTAAAHDVPVTHDGSEKFSFELRFSETPEDDFSYKTLRDHAFTVTGGDVVKARRLAPGDNVRWEITVEPGGNGAVTIVLPPTTDCEATGAVCTQDGRKLSGRLQVTIPLQNSGATGAPTISGTARVGETLTARTSGISDVDGVNGDTVAYRWIASDGATDTEISGATGFSYTLVEADVGKAIKVRVSFTDLAGNEESLTSAATAAVAAAAPAAIPEDEEEEETVLLTAGAHDVPGSHDGSTTFTFELRFSEQIPVSYITLRDHAFTVTGGDVVNARRLEQGSSDRKNVRWEISVTPDGNGAVTIVLPPTTDCEAEGAICARDGRMLSNRLEISVPGPSG